MQSSSRPTPVAIAEQLAALRTQRTNLIASLFEELRRDSNLPRATRTPITDPET
jgi:hypothetical protein